MTIVNSVYKGKKLFASEFFCPNCLVARSYEIKPMSREITLYPLPFLDKNEPSHMIECQDCRNAFDPEILSRHNQSLCRLAGVAKYQLHQGISPGFLKLQLIRVGMQESFAEDLLTIAQH